MPAILSFSDGALWPGPPSTCRGTRWNAAPAAAVVVRNLRRDNMVSGMMGGVGVNGNQRWEGMAGRGWEDRFVRHRLPMSSYYTVECEGLPSLFDTRWEPPRTEPAVVNNGGCNVAPDSEGPSGWLGRRFSTRYEFISLLLPSAVLKSGGKPPHSKGPPAIARSFPVRATGLVSRPRAMRSCTTMPR